MLEWLKTILGDGYTEEIDGKISAEIGRAFVAKQDFDGKNRELKSANDALRERDRQLEELKTAGGDAAALREQITQLQAANAAKDEAHAEELAALRLDAAVDRALSEAHAKNPATVKPLLAAFLKDAKAEEDGTVRGLADEIKKLSGSQDTAFLFEAKTETKQPQMAGAAPAGSGSIQGAGSSNGRAMTLADAIRAHMGQNE